MANAPVAPARVTPSLPPPRLTLAPAAATLTPAAGPRSASPKAPVTVSPPAAKLPSTDTGAAAPSAAAKNAVTAATSDARRPWNSTVSPPARWSCTPVASGSAVLASPPVGVIRGSSCSTRSGRTRRLRSLRLSLRLGRRDDMVSLGGRGGCVAWARQAARKDIRGV